MSAMKKILIVRLGALGDVIFELPLLAAIKEHYPEAEIGWLVGPRGVEIIKNHPLLNRCHYIPITDWSRQPFAWQTLKDAISLIREIRREKYDLAICSKRKFPLFWTYLILAVSAKRRLAYFELNFFPLICFNEYIVPKQASWDLNQHIAAKNLDFVRALGVQPSELRFPLPEVTAEEISRVDSFLSKIDASKPIIVISPATTWQQKHWADENWVEVIKAINGRCNLIFTGTKSDQGLASWLISNLGPDLDCLDLTGKTSIMELWEIFSRATVVITPDSGSAHLAWSTGKPAIITIFTCTIPEIFGPFGDDEKYFNLIGQLDCQPCSRRNCLFNKDKAACRNFPPASEVIEIVNKFLP